MKRCIRFLSDSLREPRQALLLDGGGVRRRRGIGGRRRGRVGGEGRDAESRGGRFVRNVYDRMGDGGRRRTFCLILPSADPDLSATDQGINVVTKQESGYLGREL